jgi:hypothetical protein
MLSGNKLKQAYASSMAVGRGWPSWDVSEDWLAEHLMDHGNFFFCQVRRTLNS